MSFIKNFPPETVLNLAGEIQAAPGQIVSKTLAQSKALTLTLFAFAKGEEISTHSSAGDAMVNVLSGKGKFTIDDKSYLVEAGESIVMPAEKPHAVYAEEDFKMLLIVVLP